MCLSIYETADGKIQLMEDQPIEKKKPMEPTWCFRKIYWLFMGISPHRNIFIELPIGYSLLGSGTSFAKMLQSRNPKESYDPWFAEVYL